MSDYIPNSFRGLRDWLQTQADRLPAHAAAMGITGAEQASYLSSVDALLAKAGEVVEQMDKLEVLTADLRALQAIHYPRIRLAVKRAKTHSGYTPGLGQLLDWIRGAGSFDPGAAQPSISATVRRGKVQINGTKPGFESVNLYLRRKGDPDWKPVAIRKRKFPIIDDTPLALAGTPEVREYRALGVVDDEEIGQPSAVVEIVFAG